jgi:hypothetical protein
LRIDTSGTEAGNDEEEQRQQDVCSDQNLCTADSIFADYVFMCCLANSNHELGKIERKTIGTDCWVENHESS